MLAIETRLSEVGPLQLGTPQIGVPEVGVHKVHIFQATIGTISLLQQKN